LIGDEAKRVSPIVSPTGFYEEEPRKNLHDFANFSNRERKGFPSLPLPI
jgi:hypothetical protein